MYHLRRLSALALSLAMTSLLFSPLPAAAAQEDNMPLPLSSASALLMEKETGTVLLQQNAHQKLEPASVTKVMTLLLVMEAVDSGRLSLDELVPVSAHAAGMGGSQVYLKEGEQLSVSDLIKCVAVVSGNDCAVALAERLADTHFVNCTGLPAQGHLTSAHDIALMSRELILNHPSIREYTTIWMDSIRNGAFGLTNTNRLIRFYQGATGLKTGSTDSALYCLSGTAERDGMELIAVIMKAPTSTQRFEDATNLLNYGFSAYALKTIVPEEPLPPVMLGAMAHRWEVLRQENAPLRAVVNGRVRSVGEDFYDEMIRRHLPEGQTKIANIIGEVLGREKPGIGDVWLAERIRQMLSTGELRMLREDRERFYRSVVERT